VERRDRDAHAADAHPVVRVQPVVDARRPACALRFEPGRC
jgi:hypothetical protein